MAFNKPGQVNYYDSDGNNRLKISAAMRYMQQTSSEHLESAGLSPVKLYNENMVFPLSKMCIKVHRMPQTADKLVLGTAATETCGVKFIREFTIDSDDGERLISAYSQWVLFDHVERKIMRPPSFPYPIPYSEPILNGVLGDIKIPKPPQGLKQTTTNIEVRYSHIDTNNHVNNSFYADFVCDSLPPDKLVNGIDTLTISFNSEARHGDVLEITAAEIAHLQYHVCGRRGDSVCFEALAGFKG